MTTPAPLLARHALARVRGVLDEFDEVTVEEALVGITLDAGERAEYDTVRFLGQLVRDERFHAAEEKLREQVLDKLLGRLARNTELLDAGIVGLADSEWETDAGFPR